jgi:hypothetical protein
VSFGGVHCPSGCPGPRPTLPIGSRSGRGPVTDPTRAGRLLPAFPPLGTNPSLAARAGDGAFSRHSDRCGVDCLGTPLATRRVSCSAQECSAVGKASRGGNPDPVTWARVVSKGTTGDLFRVRLPSGESTKGGVNTRSLRRLEPNSDRRTRSERNSAGRVTS